MTDSPTKRAGNKCGLGHVENVSSSVNRATHVRMDNHSSTPKDAREATDEQREQQEQLDHRNDDPDAPGQQQTRHQVADET